jgi:hypothetical protein
MEWKYLFEQRERRRVYPERRAAGWVLQLEINNQRPGASRNRPISFMDIFDSYLARIGGTNPYGQPMFRLVWGGTAKNVAFGQTATGKTGQHEYLRYHGILAWFLEFWKAPDTSPESWYRSTWDPISQMHTAGDYPVFGEYVKIAQFYTKETINGKAEIVPQPVTFQFLDDLVALVNRSKDLTVEERKQRILAEMQAEKKAAMQLAHDVYTDATPAFGGVAGTYESNREKLLDRLNLRLTADQVSPGNQQDQWKWAMQNRHLSQEEIDSQVLN